MRRFLWALGLCLFFTLLAAVAMIKWPSAWTLLLIALAGASFVYLFYRIQKFAAMTDDQSDDDDFGGNHPLPVG